METKGRFGKLCRSRYIQTYTNIYSKLLSKLLSDVYHTKVCPQKINTLFVSCPEWGQCLQWLKWIVIFSCNHLSNLPHFVILCTTKMEKLNLLISYAFDWFLYGNFDFRPLVLYSLLDRERMTRHDDASWFDVQEYRVRRFRMREEFTHERSVEWKEAAKVPSAGFLTRGLL